MPDGSQQRLLGGMAGDDCEVGNPKGPLRNLISVFDVANTVSRRSKGLNEDAVLLTGGAP